MKDIIRLNEIKPLQAEGRCTIELTDPITGKVKDRVGGKNMVFPETLMVNRWWESINSVYTVLGDDDTPSSLDFPFMRGQTIGYGQPSQAGSGLYRGAYNASNQILCKQGEGKLSWKFQYDFTAPQAIGTIKAVSLTNQFAASNYEVNFYAKISGDNCFYRDGTYGYSVTGGIITITNLYNDISTTIDISEFLQNNQAAHIAIDKATGKGYITERVSPNILIHEFSDNTFSEKINSYTISNTFDDQSISSSDWCLVKGDSIYLGAYNSHLIAKINYTDNTLVRFIEAPITIWGSPDRIDYSIPLHINDDFVYFSYGLTSSGYNVILNLNTDTIEATVRTPNGVGTFLMSHPLATHPLPCRADSSGRIYMLPCAITNYVLPAPVEKTADKGMTVTYELDVYW